MGRLQLSVVIAALVVASLAATPAAASASTFLRFGPEFRFEGDPYEDNDVTIDYDAASSTYTIRDTGTRSLLADAFDCVNDPADPRRAICLARPGDRLTALLNDGDDRYAQSGERGAIVCGGTGDDTISGGPLTDSVWGEEGNDTLSGGGEFDLLSGEETCSGGAATAPPGRDTLEGGAGPDALEGGRGTDTLVGGEGDDRLFGFAGRDELEGGAGSDFVSGDDGADTLRGGGGADVLCGGEGADEEFGQDGADQLGASLTSTTFACVDAGDDLLDGGPGDDVLEGGPKKGFFVEHTDLPPPGETDAANGADRMRGGAGDDELSYEGRLTGINASLDGLANDGAEGEHDDAGADIERVEGGAGDDSLAGGGGHDRLDGADGADILRGGGGDDMLLGGSADAGADDLHGDDGSDTLRGGAGGDGLDGGAGADQLAGEGGDDGLEGGDGDDGLEGGPGLDRVSGGLGDDRVDGAAAQLVGADGTDVLRGGPGTDTLTGGPGDDDLGGGPGPDRMAGGDGAGDLVDYTDAGGRVNVTFDDAADDGLDGEHDQVDPDVEGFRGGGEDDTVLGGDRGGRLEGGDGEDYLQGGAGADELQAGPGGDTVRTRDGSADRVGCGRGVDLAIVDALDRVASDCEALVIGRAAARAGRRAVVQPRAGEVGVGHPGALRFTPLLDRIDVALPVRLDTTRGEATAVTAGRHGRRLLARFRGAPLALHQAAAGRRLTGARVQRLTRSECAGRLRARRLETRSAGPLRTSGSGGSGVGRGAWVTEERCDGTRFRVLSGTLRVRDARGRSFRLRAGDSRLARRR